MVVIPQIETPTVATDQESKDKEANKPKGDTPNETPPPAEEVMSIVENE